MKKAVIIGAGPAGLTAAYELLTKTDIHPIILEQSDAIGGLSRTVNFSGNRMDIGGHRFFTKSEPVKALWKSIMPLASAPAFDDRLLHRGCPTFEDGVDPEQDDHVFLLRSRISRIYYLRQFFSYPVSLSLRTLRGLGGRRVSRILLSYLSACLKKRDEKTLEDFMINRFGRELYQTFFESYTEKVWGRSPSQIGANWGSQRIKGVSLRGVIKDFLDRRFGIQQKHQETSLIEQFFYPKFGPGEFFEDLAAEVQRLGGEIRFHQQVIGIQGDAGHIANVTVKRADGSRETIPADYVFSSMPVKDLCAALPVDWLPDKVRTVAETLPYRDFMTAGLLVDKLALKNNTKHKTLHDIVPDCWIYIQEPEVKIGRLQIFNNWSPYLVKDPMHTVWIGLEYFCQEGDALWSMPDADFLAFAAGELEKIGILAPHAAIKGHVVRVKKAYPAYYGSYIDFPVVREALDKVDNLYCIGRNGQHRYNNMDHSMLTAMEAVRLLKDGIADRTSLWKVNTESDYQEEESAGEEKCS